MRVQRGLGRKWVRIMLSNRLMTVLKSSSAVLFAWSTTLKTDMLLSNANRTALSTSNGNVCSDTDLTGSIYCELSTTASYSTLYYSLGLMPATSTRPGTATTTPVGGVKIPPAQPAATYGISYNAATGAYKIKKNNVLLISGALTPVANMRVFYFASFYVTGFSGTINSGQSNFTYTPEYL